MRSRLLAAASAGVLALAGLLSGCAGGDGEQPAASSSPSGSEASATGEPTPGEASESAAGSEEPSAGREVTVGELGLPGVIVTPESGGEDVVVLFLWGSGPHDKDGTIGEADNRIFRDLADGLAQHGISSLRFDKRTYAAQESIDPATFTLDGEYFDDAAAAIDLLAEDPEFEGHRIYVVGHSQGGMVLPQVLADNDEVSGGVSLAGTPRSLFDVMYDQNAAALERSELPEDQIQARNKVYRETMDLAKAIDSPDDELPLMLNGSGLSPAWVASLNALDIAGTARSLDVPMLFLQGEADQQVFFDVDFAAWQEELGGEEDVEFKSYPELNHFFWVTQGLPPMQDYDAPAHVDQEVVDDIAAWLVAQDG